MTEPTTPKPDTETHASPKTIKVAAPVPEVDDAEAKAAAEWGRVDDEGNVWLREADGERIVGQYTAQGTAADALGLYVRRYLDLQSQVNLLEQRLDHITPKEINNSLATLQKELAEPAVVGDVGALRTKLAELEERGKVRKEEVAQQRAAAKEEAVAERTAIVEAAETLAAQDPAQTHWKNSREELIQLLEQWKYQQRHGVRIDRPVEEALWKRFSSARTKFDRHRRQFFSERDAQRKEVLAQKEALIAQAEALADSTDWGATSARYRELMNDWKAAGRSSKREDDKLWERFRAAQQSFFDARAAHNSMQDEELQQNLTEKLALLTEAEKLLPVDDIEEAKKQIRLIGDKWDAIGHVPRADISRTEGRMREIERAIRDAESAQWQKTDPEKEERSAGMAQQLERLIAELEAQIAEAKAAGEDAKVKEYEDALAARKAWLKAVQE
ncbi:MAG: DUF349 domain-containing protein [Trueperella sp.]|nr:DUF349 domain-containing protein [Trueperella sp.]